MTDAPADTLEINIAPKNYAMSRQFNAPSVSEPADRGVELRRRFGEQREAK